MKKQMNVDGLYNYANSETEENKPTLSFYAENNPFDFEKTGIQYYEPTPETFCEERQNKAVENIETISENAIYNTPKIIKVKKYRLYKEEK